jgi:calcineurin B family protein 1
MSSPLEEKEKSKDVNGPDLLDSQSNKLHFAFRWCHLDKDDLVSCDCYGCYV